jgi:hypothetical protein
MDTCRTTQLTFGFGRFFGQDVTFERLTAFDSSTRADAKALFGAALRFHFRHDTSCPLGQFLFNMFAGDNNFVVLVCLFTLVLTGESSPLFFAADLMTGQADETFDLLLFLR